MRNKMVYYNTYRFQYGHEEEILEKRGEEGLLDRIDMFRSLRAEIKICKVDNENILNFQGI